MILKVALVGLAVFLAWGAFNTARLQQIQIIKTTEVKADIETVYNNVALLNNFPKWSPFLEADPGQKIEVKGDDGKIGAQFHWEGNGGKDLGYQEIKEIEHLKYIKMECQIEKPFKAQPTFEYSFSQNGNITTVKQEFNLSSGFIDAFFMGLFGAKNDMDKMNARGMELLKKASERK